MLTNIEIDATVNEEGNLILPPFPDVRPSDYRITLVIEEQLSPKPKKEKAPLVLPIHDVDLVEPNSSFSRADIPERKVFPELRDFPVISVGAWPQDLSLRREEMYEYDGD